MDLEQKKRLELEKQVRRANARNVRLYYPYRQYTNLITYEFWGKWCPQTQNRYSTRSPTPVKTCPIFFMRTSKIRHFDAILTPSWQVSPALLTFRRHLPATKADILLTFCTYKVLYARKTGGQNYRGNLLGDVLMATMRCARQHARGHQHQRRRHGVGLLVDYLFCASNERWPRLYHVSTRWREQLAPKMTNLVVVVVLVLVVKSNPP